MPKYESVQVSLRDESEKLQARRLGRRRASAMVVASLFVVGAVSCVSVFRIDASISSDDETETLGSSGPTSDWPPNDGSPPFDFTHSVIQSETGEWRVVLGVHPDAAAVAAFTDANTHPSHFGELSIRSLPSSKFSDAQRARAAGIAEGFLTNTNIVHATHNLRCQVRCDGTVPAEIRDFLDAQWAWAETMVANHLDDHYWRHVDTVMQQFLGLAEGVRLSSPPPEPPLTLWDFELLNHLGDLFDLMPALLETKRVDFSTVSPHEASKRLRSSGHCSAIIKVTDAMDDLLIGHSSWFSYSAMNRIFKHYELAFEGTAATRMSFSSYPGMISSLDDFYVMEPTGLLMTQTTNGIYNQTLYDFVLPASLPAWMRVRVSNAIAETGAMWATTVAQWNSGT